MEEVWYQIVVHGVEVSIPYEIILFGAILLFLSFGEQWAKGYEVDHFSQRDQRKTHEQTKQTSNVRQEFGEPNQLSFGEASEVCLGKEDVDQSDVFPEID